MIKVLNSFNKVWSYVVHKLMHHSTSSYNLSHILKFTYLVRFLNAYESQIWTQPYIYSSNRKYKVTLAIVMLTNNFLLSI